MTRFLAFARLSRLKFLAGGIAGGLFGTVLAEFDAGAIDWGAYAVAQSTITALHLMTHYANDYFDRDCDGLTQRTPYSGGSGILGAGYFVPAVALGAALACALAGALGCIALSTFVQRPPAAALALAIGLLAWFYSAPPVRFCARGLGEGVTALVVGMLVPLCAYAAQRGWPDASALASVLPGAAAMFVMMLAVEYPDLAADALTGKRNLLVRLDAARIRSLALCSLVAIYAAVGAALVLGAPLAFGVLEAASLPLAFAYARTLVRRSGGERELDEALAGRGVALFFIVTLYAALGYGAVVSPAGLRRGSAETNRSRAAVEESVIETTTLESRLNAALEEVRPSILRDGGDVWLIKIEAGVAYVQMVGACGGCAMSTSTLKGAIETVVRLRCPEIERVEQI